ncbi:unnamed protein product [Orchesella dallaii]|uniref:rRNA adenine N(6)-methyltransferase n=1 Tax=Orchesella dallaii TaxID=48710 RepID=A0ABP1RZS2_9HEXA
MALQGFAVGTIFPGAKYLRGPIRSFFKMSNQSSISSLSSVWLNKYRSRGVTSTCNTPKVAPTAIGDENSLQPEFKIHGKKIKKDKSQNLSPKPITASEKAILNYIDTHGQLQTKEKDRNLKNLLPKQYLRVKTDPTIVYLINTTAAKTFSNAIKAENPDRNSPVLEIQPGLGLLTSELLNTVGYKYLTGLEDNPELATYLASEYNIAVIECSISDIPRYHHLDKHDGGERIHEILNKIKTSTNSNEDRRLHIVGTAPNIGTINFLIRSYATKRIFFEDGLPWNGVTLFLALGSKVHAICTASPESGLVTYRTTSVFCQSLFHFKKIAVLPRDAFIPWDVKDTEVRKGPKTRKIKVVNPDLLTVMRVDINEEAANLIGRENLFAYWYFVREHLYARTNRIIPELEKWCPGCGRRLIRQGFDIYSIFGELTPDEILKLYLQFVSWPEFSYSSFLNAVEKFQTRIEISEDGDH